MPRYVDDDKELIQDIANFIDVTYAKAKEVVAAIGPVMMAAIKRGDYIEIRGFAGFKPRTKPPKRHYRNLIYKDVITIPAKPTIRFRASKELKMLVNPGEYKVAYTDPGPTD